MSVIKTQFYGVVLFALLMTFISCTSISGFQTGKVMKKGENQYSTALNATRNYSFGWASEKDDLSNLFTYPIVDLSFRRGLSDKLELGFKMNTSFNLILDTKYQFFGDQESTFAISTGLGLGIFLSATEDSPLLNFHVPLYTSYHPLPYLDLYLAPRYIGQFGTENYNHFIGFNSGFLIGKFPKFGVDFGFFKLKTNYEGTVSVFNVGIGLVFIPGKK